MIDAAVGTATSRITDRGGGAEAEIRRVDRDRVSHRVVQMIRVHQAQALHIVRRKVCDVFRLLVAFG